MIVVKASSKSALFSLGVCALGGMFINDGLWLNFVSSQQSHIPESHESSASLSSINLSYRIVARLIELFHFHPILVDILDR